MTNTPRRTNSTRTPASSAARGLSPTANTRRPNTVPCSPHCASAQTAARTATASGKYPDHRHVVEHEPSEHAKIVGQIAARRAARPHHRRAVDRQQRPESGDDRRGLEIGDDRAVDEPDEEADCVEDGDRPPGLRRIVGRQHRPADHGQRDERADGEIEPAADEHEQLARRQDGEGRGAAEEIHRPRRLEIVRLQQSDGDIEREKHDDGEIDPPHERNRASPFAAPLDRDGHATCPRVRNV